MIGDESQNEWVAQALGIAIPAKLVDEEPIRGSTVSFAKLKLRWNQARSVVIAQLTNLHAAVTSEYDDPEAAASSQKILRMSEHFNEELADTLDELYNAQSERDRAMLRARAGAIAATYQNFIETDPLVGHLDVNPFVPVGIVAQLSSPLHELQVQIEVAAQRDAT